MALLLKSKGFSMIEALIAIVILSISLLALAGLMATSTKNNSFGSNMTEAVTFAQSKLEELRVTPWAQIVTNQDSLTGSTGIIYTRNWDVTNLPNPSPPPTDFHKSVTIRVTWNDGLNRSISILSVIAD